MKMKTKALLVLACAVMLVAASVFGTLTYLTDNDAVTNTFTVGKVNITLDEALVTENGVPAKLVEDTNDVDQDNNRTEKIKEETTLEKADRVKANTYKLLPGCTYVKDPTVTVKAGSEETYIRMFVKVENIGQLEATFPIEKYGDKYYGTEVKNGEEIKVFLLQNLVSGWDSNIWQYVGYEESADGKTGVYEFRYVETETKTVDASMSTTDITLDALFCEPVANKAPSGFALTVEIIGSDIQSLPTSVVTKEWSSGVSGVTAVEVDENKTINILNIKEKAISEGGQ